jgi:hypothetical protein
MFQHDGAFKLEAVKRHRPGEAGYRRLSAIHHTDCSRAWSRHDSRGKQDDEQAPRPPGTIPKIMKPHAP